MKRQVIFGKVKEWFKKLLNGYVDVDPEVFVERSSFEDSG